MSHRPKLIEIALPLEAINRESAREKSIRHGHPSTLHLWWARRPLAACRSVLWASLIDDPSGWPDKFPTEESQQKERQRLFDILGRIEILTDKKGNSKEIVRGLVSWDDVNDTNSSIIIDAQREIARCLAWNRGENPPVKIDDIRNYIAKYAPPAYDPFSGGGSIPLESQRLGLIATGSDLNPVAVMISKALIEIPPKFKDIPPVNPNTKQQIGTWYKAQGLAEDIRYYGQWMRDEAYQKIGHLYPKVMVEGKEATVIAWLWARTVKCPNPGCGCQMPLVNSFQLSTKKDKEAWVNPIIVKDTNIPRVEFEVKTGKGGKKEGTVNRKGAICIACDNPVQFTHIRSEGKGGRIGTQLMAIVAEGNKGRVYLSPNSLHGEVFVQPEWKPEAELVGKSAVSLPLYGMPTYGDLFTPRQLVALTTFSDLVTQAREKVIQDAIIAGMDRDDTPLHLGGRGATAYGDGVATYLAFGVDKMSDYHSSICSWHSGRDTIRNTFARQAIPMTWDFVEANPMSDSTGNFNGAINWVVDVIEKSPATTTGEITQKDATAPHTNTQKKIISTDPPYYDNIGYADLSDYFYVWMRKSLQTIYPNLFTTLLTPKTPELVATPYRFNGDKQQAKNFFEEGLGKAFEKMYEIAHPEYPLTVYYAFKQAETEINQEIASTGWETMLEGLIKSGFMIDGTWPMRTERSARTLSIGTNALASSIVLVCRPRPLDAPKSSRMGFLREIKKELPKGLKLLQQGNIAPVDFAQASIGPGIAIFSKYKLVFETDGTPMKIREVLQLINQILDEFLNQQEGEFDSDTKWALTWFEQHQFNEGLFGDAETLSKAKNTSVKGLVDSGILVAKEGKVRLLKREEYPPEWNPQKDKRVTIWKATQYLIHCIDKKGEMAAAETIAQLGGKAYQCRDLAYRLYNMSERLGWAEEGIFYNYLVSAWSEVIKLSSEFESKGKQMSFI